MKSAFIPSLALLLFSASCCNAPKYDLFGWLRIRSLWIGRGSTALTTCQRIFLINVRLM